MKELAILVELKENPGAPNKLGLVAIELLNLYNKDLNNNSLVGDIRSTSVYYIDGNKIRCVDPCDLPTGYNVVTPKDYSRIKTAELTAYSSNKLGILGDIEFTDDTHCIVHSIEHVVVLSDVDAVENICDNYVENGLYISYLIPSVYDGDIDWSELQPTRPTEPVATVEAKPKWQCDTIMSAKRVALVADQITNAFSKALGNGCSSINMRVSLARGEDNRVSQKLTDLGITNNIVSTGYPNNEGMGDVVLHCYVD